MRLLQAWAMAVAMLMVLTCSLSASMPARAATVPDDAAALRDFDRPARLVDVGGRRLNLRCAGHGAPTVVFESALGGASWDWAPVQARVSRHTRACAYDRAGFGASDPGPLPATTASAAADLAALLQASGEPGPYVLVGASYGAMIVRHFAASHPGQVSALVLVDGHHEDERERLDRVSSGRYGQLMDGWLQSVRDCAAAARTGLVEGTPPYEACVGPAPAFATPQITAAHRAQVASAAYWEAQLSEVENLYHASAQQMRELRHRLPAVPVLALVRSVSPFDTPGQPRKPVSFAVEKENARMQADIASLSPRGRTRVVPRASHAIHMDQPAAVSRAVLEFVPKPARR